MSEGKWVVYILLPTKKRACLCKSIAIEWDMYHDILCKNIMARVRNPSAPCRAQNPQNRDKSWEAAGLGNRPKRENSKKCLGEGAKFWVVQKTFRRPLLPGSKRPFAPSPKHFLEFSLFGRFPRPAASQDKRVSESKNPHFAPTTDKGVSSREKLHFPYVVSVAPPAEPRGENFFFFVQILGGEKLLKLLKSAGEIFLKGLRGAKNFSNAFRIALRIFFSRFSNRFSCQIKSFSGAVSFCRHAALICCPVQKWRFFDSPFSVAGAQWGFFDSEPSCPDLGIWALVPSESFEAIFCLKYCFYFPRFFLNRRRTNVQQLACNIDLSCSFYYLFFSFVLLELKPFVLKGKVLGEKF